MTPLSLLAQARALGVVLEPEPPDTIRLRGQTAALSSELRARLKAVKPELLALLTEADARQLTVADVWAAAYLRIQRAPSTAWPMGGLDILQRIRPGLFGKLDWAERDAERVSCAHRDGTADAETLRLAVARWEALALGCAELLTRCCHDCGGESLVALVDPTDGARYCRRCARPGVPR